LYVLKLNTILSNQRIQTHPVAPKRQHVNTLTLKHILVYILLLAGFLAQAQPYNSRLGRFQVDQKRGCAPFTITLTNLLPGTCVPGTSPCAIDYENTGNFVTNPPVTHTYTTAGTYKLSVLYQSLAVQLDDITITVDQNIQPNFELHACSGNKASIQVIDANYDQYIIDFNTTDGVTDYALPYSNNIVTPGYSYTTAGAYTTAVHGRHLNAADNCASKTQVFTTYATLPIPKMNTLTSVDNTSVKLDFTTSANIQYKLEISVNSGTFQQFQTLFGVNTYTVTGLKLDVNYYCFRIGAFDPCLSANTYSGTVCSDVFTLTAVSDVNQLAWTTGNTGSVAGYNISRDDGTGYNNIQTQTLNDVNIKCKTKYCYQITTNYAGGAKSISLSKCVTSFSNKIPTGIDDLSSVVSATGVDLTWSQDPKFTPINYTVQRSDNGGVFGFLGLVSTTKASDNSYTTEGKICYRVHYIDKCDNASPEGATACPLALTVSLSHSNVATLNWNAYTGWANGVKNYVLEKYNLQGALIKSFTLTDITFVDDVADPNNQLVQYVVKAIPNGIALLTSVSNRVEVIKDSNLYYPTAFSPNNDNLNDGFIVSGQFIVKMSLKIFDRWGVLLFTTEKNEPWNGLRDGKPLPPSTYIWKADITDLAGQVYSKEGTIVLISN
jgi:gliding motility-associated-like protein